MSWHDTLKPGDPVVVTAWRGRSIPNVHRDGVAIFMGWQQGGEYAKVLTKIPRRHRREAAQFPYVHRSLLEPLEPVEVLA